MHPLLQENLITTRNAGEISGYTSDYLTRLARLGKIEGKRTGHTWLIDKASLARFTAQQSDRKIEHERMLTRLRGEEYRKHRSLSHPTEELLSRPRDTLPFGILKSSFRSQALAFSVALLVVVSGAFAAQAALAPEVISQAKTIVSTLSSGFDTIVTNGLSSPLTGSLASGYVAVGTDTYAAIVTTLSLYQSLIEYSGMHSLAFAVAARDAFDAMPQFVSSMNLAFGTAIIDATHALIRADVALSYGIAAAAPESARATVTLIGSVGDILARATEGVPARAVALYVQTTAVPASLAPRIAKAVFDAEYALATPFVALTQNVSERYLAGVEDAGRFVYARTADMAVLTGGVQPLFANVSTALENVYLGALGQGSLTLDSLGGTLVSASRLPTLAAALSALSIAEQSALATYETIQSFFSSVGNTFAALFGKELNGGVVSNVAPPTGLPFATSTAPVNPSKPPSFLLTPPQPPPTTARTTTVTNYPTYTTVVQGVSSDALQQSLATLRADILTTVAGLIQPVSQQAATNATTIQQVNMIQDLSNLIVRNGDFRGGSLTNATSISATTATFNTLTSLAISGSATSTSNVGYNITSGCFAINGTCIGGSGGSGTVDSGTTGQFPYYASAGTTLTATSSLFLATNQNIGIGTTSPSQALSVFGKVYTTGGVQFPDGSLQTAAAAAAAVGTQGQIGFYNTNGSTLSGTSTIFIATNQNVGIGTTTPGTLLSLGNTGANTINLSATATSTFGSGVNILTGCFAINGVCVGSGAGTVTAVTGTWPVISSGGTTPNITWGGLSTSTAAVVGNIPYFSGANTFANVATTTATLGSEFSYSGTFGSLVGGASGSLTLATNGTALTKLAQIAANSLLGNGTGATGNVTALSTSTLNIGGTASNVTGTVLVANGGTGATTFTSSQLLYGNGTAALTSVATTSLSVGATLSSSGTLGSQIGGSNTTLSLNLANANAWTALQQFTNASTSRFSAYGPAYFGATATSSFSSVGALTLASALVETSGGTGQNSYTTGDILYASGANTLGKLAVGSVGQVLKVSGGVPAWGADNTSGGGSSLFASTTDNLAIYPSTVSNVLLLGASATTTTGNIFEVLGNSLFRGTLTTYNTLNAPVFNATSTTATSTFAAGIQTTALNVTGTSATSTFARGIDLSGGCFAINGTCLSTSGSGITALGSGFASTTGTTITFSTTTLAFNGLTFGQTIVPTAGALLFTPTVTGTLTVGGGGTGATTFTSSQLLYGNGTAALTSVATSSLAVGTGLTNSGTLGSQVGGTNASISFAPIAANSLWVNQTGASAVPTAIATSSLFSNASASITGLLSSTDWSTFNNKQATISATYPITLTGAAIGLAFGTTTSNTWAGTQTFTNAPTLTSLATPAGTFLAVDASGVIIATTTPAGGGSGTVGSGTTGQFPYYAANGTTLTATSSLFLATNQNVGVGSTTPYAKLSVKGGGTGTGVTFQTTDSNNAPTLTVFDNGNVGIGTVSPTNKLQVTGLVSFSSQLSVGSYGTFVGSNTQPAVYLQSTGVGTGTGSLLSFTGYNTGFAAYLNFATIESGYADGTAGRESSYFSFKTYVVGTTTERLRIDRTGNVGIGTSTPWAQLSVSSVNATSTKPLFAVSSSSIAVATSTLFIINGDGNVGIGTTSPWAQLSINPNGITGPAFAIGSSTATRLIVTNGGLVGIGTTSPTSLYGGLFASAGPLFVGGLPATATSTFEGNVQVRGTLQIGTGSLYLSENDIKASNGNLFLSSTATSTITNALSLGGKFVATGLSSDSTTIGIPGVLCLSSSNEVIKLAGVATCIVSSARFKNDIATSTAGLDLVRAMRPVSFLYNGDNGAQPLGTQLGFIAEEVAKLDSRLVVYDTKGLPFSVRYENFTAVLAGAIQELDAKFLVPTAAITTLSSAVLTADGKGVDLYKLATFTLSGVQALGDKLDGQTVRLTSLEDRVAKLEGGGTVAATGSSTTLSTTSLASAFNAFGAFIQKGIAQFGSLVADQFVAATNADGQSSAGTATLLAGNTVVEVTTTYMKPSTKVFITFNAQVTGNWWVSEKTAGSFRVTLSAPQTTDVSFDYFLVQTAGQVATSTPEVVLSGGGTTSPVITPTGVGSQASPAVLTISTSSPQTTASSTPVAEPAPVAVAESTPPVVTLVGAAAMEVSVGDAFTDPGATALDDTDGDLTAKVVATGAVDTTIAGLYTLVYSATDAAGNTGSVSRVVTALAPIAVAIVTPPATTATTTP